jgi:hypothetical protein
VYVNSINGSIFLLGQFELRSSEDEGETFDEVENRIGIFHFAIKMSLIVSKGRA